MAKLNDYTSYGDNYSASALWDKIKNVALKAGVKVIYAALLLYYVATSSDVSKADKAKIFGALGYFILPVDLIPDFTPLIGYTDDMTALLGALRAVWGNVTPAMEAKAKDKLKEWFGTISRNDLKLF